ncbi:MAG: hypothetical protein AB8H79_04825 [Myxococcota bacterium]
MWMLFLVAAALAGPSDTAPSDLDGTWVPVGEHEAKQKTVAVQSCWSRRQTWTLTQAGAKVTAVYNPANRTSGARRVDTYRTSASLNGRWKEGVLMLAGDRITVHTNALDRGFREQTRQPMRLSLTLDQKTGHLVGTDEDGPVRWAPADLSPIDRSVCPPPPP